MFDQAGPVLGIDPGLSRCGYGAVHPGGGGAQAVAFGVIRTPPSDPLPERLALLEAELAALIAELRPCAMAVERVLFQANVRTAISVGQASGIALAVAARAGIGVTHYSPNEVKLAVTGFGAAEKSQVQAMVRRLLSLADKAGVVHATHQDLARDRGQLSCKREQRGRLARAVRSDQRDDFARLDVQIDVAHHCHPSVTGGQTAALEQPGGRGRIVHVAGSPSGSAGASDAPGASSPR